jgi:ribosomal protein S18 acetylase RimI-like enzyme
MAEVDHPFCVRAARRGDIGAIVEMQLLMALETEGLALDRAVLARGVARPFDDPALASYFVAEVAAAPGAAPPGDDTAAAVPAAAAAAAAAAGPVVAVMMLTREWSDWRDGSVQWIESVYVDAAHRRRGAFRALYAHCKAAAAADPLVAGLRLYVETENARAVATYEAMGMQREHYTMMKWMKGDM